MSKNKSLINWQLFLGLLLVLTGGAFLADSLLPGVKIMAYGWPIIVVLLGVIFFVGLLIAGRKGAGLAIPGALITSLGLLLFLQNTFNLWLTWTYAWALLISALGCGLIIMNVTLKRPGLRKAGGVLIGVGLVLFVIFGIFFEIILDISGENNAGVIFLSIGLVLLGLFIISSRFLFFNRKKKQSKKTDSVLDISPATVTDVENDTQIPSSESEVGEEFTSVRNNSMEEVSLQQGEPTTEVVNTDTGNMIAEQPQDQ